MLKSYKWDECGIGLEISERKYAKSTAYNRTNCSDGWRGKLRNVEAWIAVKLAPGPYLLEHTVLKGNVFRNVVAWCGGPLPIDFSSCYSNQYHPTAAPQIPPPIANINHDTGMLNMINVLTQTQELHLRRTTLLEEKYEELSKCMAMQMLNGKVPENLDSNNPHGENTLKEAIISPLVQKFEETRES